MNVACAWCKESMGTKEPVENNETSHGICPECLKKVEHPSLQLYRIYNRALKQYGGKDVLAANPLEACDRFGWSFEDCWVRVYTTSNINPDSGSSAGGWKYITPREGRDG